MCLFSSCNNKINIPCPERVTGPQQYLKTSASVGLKCSFCHCATNTVDWGNSSTVSTMFAGSVRGTHPWNFQLPINFLAKMLPPCGDGLYCILQCVYKKYL